MKAMVASEETVELGEILAAYNQVTEQLKGSHDRLQREVVRLRRELAQKNRELERRKRLAALGEMAAGLAHEIRNPLQGIQLYTDMLGQDSRENPSALKLLDKITAAIRSLDCLVSDVLAFAHNITCCKSKVTMGSIVEQTLDIVRPLCNPAEVRFEVDPLLGSLEVYGDGQLLHRMLLNLLRNAVEATGPQAVIRLWGRPITTPFSGVEIKVADDGPGFDAEIIDRVFDPFFTTKDSGTGIGLSIVHGIVEAHGGIITAGNLPEGGAVVTVRLPDERRDRPES